VTLNAKTEVASVRPLYYDEALAKRANGRDAGKLVHLALVDPDSSEVVPSASPRFAGDFMLTSQADKEQIFDQPTGKNAGLKVLHLSNSVDDTAWATARFGALYTTDSAADTLDEVSGRFTPGTAYSAVTPCDAGNAPATCPGPGFPVNYLGTDNLTTGALGKVPTTGAALQPKRCLLLSVE
jgi:hypothetical protein